jgi:hypothetical protein
VVSELKRSPLWKGLDPPLRYMYIVAQYGLYSLKEKYFQNIQHKLLLRIQQLTTNHTVRQCTCISEEDPDLSIMGTVLAQTPFFATIYVVYFENISL